MSWIHLFRGLACSVCLVTFLCSGAFAHHSQTLGNPLGVDVYSLLTPYPDHLAVLYIIDFGDEARSMQMLQLDTNNDLAISDEEAAAYFDKTTNYILSRINVTLDGAALEGYAADRQIYRPGYFEVPILRIVYYFRYPYDLTAEGTITYSDVNYRAAAGGNRDVQARVVPGIAISIADLDVISDGAPVNYLEEIDVKSMQPKDVQNGTITFAVQSPSLVADTSLTGEFGALFREKHNTSGPQAAPMQLWILSAIVFLGLVAMIVFLVKVRSRLIG